MDAGNRLLEIQREKFKIMMAHKFGFMSTLDSTISFIDLHVEEEELLLKIKKENEAVS